MKIKRIWNQILLCELMFEKKILVKLIDRFI